MMDTNDSITSIDGALPSDLVDRYLSALLNGDRRACRAMIEKQLESETPVRAVYEQLFQSSLYRVGALWECGRVSVATEHLATAITEGLMSLVYPAIFEAPHVGHSAVVSCVANEYHQIGGRMVADMFELNGWHGYFLGSNTPVEELLKLIDEKRPDVLALSLTVYFSMDALLRAARTVRSTFADLPIWVGGQAFRWGGEKQLAEIQGTALLKSLAELEQRAIAWESPVV